jgi:hypothetical protein
VTHGKSEFPLPREGVVIFGVESTGCFTGSWVRVSGL